MSTAAQILDMPPGREAVARRLRFTRDGDEALERHLERVCGYVRSGVCGLIPDRKLEAVLLGGGYGRGEGGVLRSGEGDRPYNDLEFYVVVRGNRHLNEFFHRHALEALAQILTHLAGLEVEFRITSLRELALQPPSMFSYDLLRGHRLLHGKPVLRSELDGAEIPAAEATRLLMNRGTGLLFSRAKLAGDSLSPESADFIRRNIAKAGLACGDAVLAALGLYHSSCLERHRRLGHIVETEPSAWHRRLLAAHADGVEFKLHPAAECLPRRELERMLAETTELSRICWLWVEGCRLGRNFATVRDYAEDSCDKCPGTSRIRNRFLNVRTRGSRVLLDARSRRHPRERVFHSLALLLWDESATSDVAVRARLQRELDTDAVSFEGLVGAYERLWRQVR